MSVVKKEYPAKDYHDFCTINMPKSERVKLYIGDIYDNSATCRKCGDKVRSKNKHHMQYCKCGAIAVDGGSHYLKRAGQLGDVIENFVLFNDVKDSQ